MTNQPDPIITDLHYEWELEDADGEWQAGGSSNNLDEVRAAGTYYLTQYAKDGGHKFIIREHRTRTIQEILIG